MRRAKQPPAQREIIARTLTDEAKRARAEYLRALKWPSGARVFSDAEINRMLDPRGDRLLLYGTGCRRDDRVAMAVFAIVGHTAAGGRDRRATLHGERVGPHGREHWRKVLRDLLRKREPVTSDARAIIAEHLGAKTPEVLRGDADLSAADYRALAATLPSMLRPASRPVDTLARFAILDEIAAEQQRGAPSRSAAIERVAERRGVDRKTIEDYVYPRQSRGVETR